jgi:hypothetical protein
MWNITLFFFNNSFIVFLYAWSIQLLIIFMLTPSFLYNSFYILVMIFKEIYEMLTGIETLFSLSEQLLNNFRTFCGSPRIFSPTSYCSFVFNNQSWKQQIHIMTKTPRLQTSVESLGVLWNPLESRSLLFLLARIRGKNWPFFGYRDFDLDSCPWREARRNVKIGPHR